MYAEWRHVLHTAPAAAPQPANHIWLDCSGGGLAAGLWPIPLQLGDRFHQPALLVEDLQLDGVGRTWHVLDNGVVDPTVTLLCVHGNPTWSYLWRKVLARAGAGVRVVAVDQLEMGFSERSGRARGLQQRQRCSGLENVTSIHRQFFPLRFFV